MTASESHAHLVSDRGKAIWITHWLQTARKTMPCPQRGPRPDKEGFCLQRSLLERRTKVSISSGRCFCLDSKHVIQKVTLGTKGEMGQKSVVSEVSPIFSSANRPSVLKGGMEPWFLVKEFTPKSKKPRQLSSHRSQGNAVRVAKYRLGATGWVEDVTRDQVLLGLYKFLESPSFGDRTEDAGGYVVFQPGRAPKYLKKMCPPCQLVDECL